MKLHLLVFFALLGFGWFTGRVFGILRRALTNWITDADWYQAANALVLTAFYVWMILGSWKFCELIGVAP